MHDILMWFHNTGLGVFMRAHSWTFTTALVLHFIGICLLIGTMLIVDLRLLGFAKQIPFSETFRLLPIALIAFSINAITGYAFFVFDPVMYAGNPAFRVKVVLLALGGINALWFTLFEHKKLSEAPDEYPTDLATKISASLSLLLWFTVILFGRLIVAFQGSTSFFA